MKSERWLSAMAVFAMVALLVVAARQGVLIAEHGFVGWLEGGGGWQTEWEIGAALLALVCLVALIVWVLWRIGEHVAACLYVHRMVRAVRRERREAAGQDHRP